MDGKKLASELKQEIVFKTKKLKEDLSITPFLATILVGDNPSSKNYVKWKCRDCEEIGIPTKVYKLPEEVQIKELLDLIHQLNEDKKVHGILVQFPLPPHLDKKKITAEISPEKDVDGLHPLNVGKLWRGMYKLDEDLLPCTPKGIMKLLDHYKVELRGKLAVIINRSDLVGKPLSKLFLDRDATVITCHSKTRELEKYAKLADILVTAVGRRPDFTVDGKMVKDGAVVVDVGTNYVEGKLCGDVDFQAVEKKVSYITPVPGGVGPMTRAMLLHNVLIAAKRSNG